MKERGILFSAPMVRAILAGRKTQTRRIVKNLGATARKTFRSDLIGLGLVHEHNLVATAGHRYIAHIANAGAVSVHTPAGQLGAKPGEFDFICPYADGRTYLDETPDAGGWRIDVEPGQRLWVKEAVRLTAEDADGYDCAEYVADGALTPLDTWPWKRNQLPGMFMPRGLSRITLDVVGVRVERLHDISAEDVIAEGIDATGHTCPCEACCRTSTPCPATASSLVMAYADLWAEINGRESWDANPWVWVIEFRRST